MFFLRPSALRKTVALFLMTAALSCLHADDWVIAARKFSFAQKGTRSSVAEGAASLIPTLVLERISVGLDRETSAEELKDREYEKFRTERQSLFLQLSKEVKERDSVVVSERNADRAQKKIAEIEKKIDRIKKDIDENVKKSSPDYSSENDPEKKAPSFFQAPPFLRKNHASDIPAREEHVVLYKNSPDSLFEAEGSVGERRFEKAVIDAKINGLIDGVINVYGDYASVTCTLRVFPGAKVLGTVTEVGPLSDVISIAGNIARYIVPVVTNSLPAEIFFDIQPEECRSSVKIIFDGVVYNKVPPKIIARSGIHSLEVECDGFVSKSLAYNFSGGIQHRVFIPMEKTNPAVVSLTLFDPVPGSLYADGIFSGRISHGIPSASATVNGSPVMGRFVSEERGIEKIEEEYTDSSGKKKTRIVEKPGDKLGFFYYIPENLQKDGAQLLVKGKSVDNAAVIDKRRIWTYRGYTALVLSLPVTLFGTGKYNSSVNAYNSGYLGDISEVEKWNTVRIVSGGITIACASFFVFELVRYLRAASSVLPQNAVYADDDTIEAAREKSLLIVDEKVSSEVLEEASDVSEETSAENADK